MAETPDQRDTSNDPASLGSGELGALIRSIDWSATPLGPMETWSPSLRMSVRFLLANRFPLILWWGPDYIQFYNDAYRPIPGTKHPKSLGQPARECWPEIWRVIGPLIDRPFEGGPATWMEDILLEVNRHGFVEETHFTIAYSPVPDDTVPHGIGGVLGTVHEITAKVVGERRVVILRDLGSRAAEAKTAEQACTIAVETLAKHARDVPFAMLYLMAPDGRRAHLVGTAGAGDETFSPPVVELGGNGINLTPWPFAQAIRTESMQRLDGLQSRFPVVPAGPWSDPPDTAVVMPIPSNKAHDLAGFLVAGISSRLKLDEHYRDFLELMTTQIATGIANARAYEEERKRAEALAEIDRAKTTFFSNVSHEFRTPLTLMLGPVEDLLGRGDAELAPAVRRQLEIVHRNSLRLLKLVNSLLDFSRIEAGRVQASYEPVDLAALTAELASVFRSAIERAGLRLVVNCRSPVWEPPAYVDRDMWEKIVLNLLSNAFKFTLDGTIAVRLDSVDGLARLTVQDTGIGIPAAELPRMFERFHRVKDSRGRTHEGTGIGLALVQELVKLHGGTVTVESVLGEGSTFTVMVPLGRRHLDPRRVGKPSPLSSTGIGATAFVEEALRWIPDDDGRPLQVGPPADPLKSDGPGPSHETPSHRNGKLGHIIWADDNADMRAYVARLLEGRLDVHTAPDGQAALEAARANPPDLVLSDVMMPKLDGFGLLRALRADPSTEEIPIILLSARAGEESRIEGAEAGADDYLVKPFSARELVARVETHVKMSRMRRDSKAALRESEARLTSQKEALELAMGGASADEVLDVVVRAARAHAGYDARTAIYIVDPDGQHLRFAASDGMPPEYTSAVDHFVNGLGFPSCGTAALTGKPVIVPDIEDDPLWAPWLDLTRRHGIRACFSFPIHSFGGKVLGTLAVYHGTPREPHPRTLEVIGLLARTAGVIIEWHKATEARARAEARQSMLVHELNHRVRNSLALAQSLAVQTLRSTVLSVDALDLLESRLAALARAHDILTFQSWEWAGLGQIVEQALEPFRRAGDNITVAGPEVRLSPKQTLAISMALHELATNAMKYGALSVDEGRVTLVWSILRRSGSDELELTWTENGGPIVSGPKRKGFGSRLIERSLAHELGGAATIEYRPDGVITTIRTRVP